MRQCSLTPFLLLPLLAVAPLAAGEAAPKAVPASAVSKAKEVMRARKPKEAIPLLVGLITEKRDKLEESAEALIQLVKCFQMLKGDAAAEAQYVELSAKYLSKPPPLDGRTLPTMDAASEDLLWKAWLPGQACRFTFVLSETGREARLERDGTVERKVNIHFEVDDVDGGQPAGDKMTGQLAMLGQQKKVARLGSAVAWPQTLSAIARVGDKQFIGTAFVHSSIGLSVQVTFKDFPADIQRIDEITATLRLTQPRQMEETLVPLRKGATWTAGGENGTITEVSNAGGRTVVKCTSEPIAGKEARGGHSSSTGSSSSSSGMGGVDSGEGDADAPVSLVTPDGRTFTPRGCSVSSTNGDKTMQYTFIGAEKADRLRLRSTLALSIREVPLKASEIKLP